MRIPLKIILQEIIVTYDVKALVDEQGWIYMRIEKGMYGLKQAGIISNQELVKHIAPFGYHTVQHTPGLWVHDNRKTLLVLWSKISVFDIAQQRIPTILKFPSEPNTSSHSTCQQQYTVGLSSSGTMCTEPLHF